MTAPIVLEVVGVPQPQGNKTPMRNQHSGRIAMVEGRRPEAREAFKSWRAAVTTAARDWLADNPMPPLAEPVRVTAGFRFPPTASNRYRTLHVTRPDCDKLSRAVLDSLVHGGLLRDDSFVCELSATKRYIRGSENVGCTVTVEPLGAFEALYRDRRKAAAAEARRRRRSAGAVGATESVAS